jgi:hypothetical protein
VVTATSENSARVWDAATGDPVTPPLLHNSPVARAAFSPDGRRVLTVSERGVRVWHASNGQPLTPPLQHRDEVLHATFSTEGRRVLVLCQDHTVRVWSVAVSEADTPTLDHDDQVLLAAFSADGRFLATAAADHGVRLWSLGREVPTPVVFLGGDSLPPRMRNPTNAMVGPLSPLAGGAGQRLRGLTNAVPGPPPLKFTGAPQELLFGRDNRSLLVVSTEPPAERQLRVWDLRELRDESRDGKRIAAPLKPPRTFPELLALSPDGRRLLLHTREDRRRLEVEDLDAAGPRKPGPPFGQRPRPRPRR